MVDALPEPPPLASEPPVASAPPSVLAKLEVEDAQFVVTALNGKVVQYQGRLFEAAKLPKSAACLSGGAAVPCVAGLKDEAVVKAAAVQALGQGITLLKRVYSTERAGLLAHFLLPNGRDVSVIDEATAAVVKTYSTSSPWWWNAMTRADYYNPLARDFTTYPNGFQPSLAFDVQPNAAEACLRARGNTPSVGVGSYVPLCFGIDANAAAVPALPEIDRRALGFYFWGDDLARFTASSRAAYSSEFSFDDDVHPIAISLVPDVQCGEVSANGCARWLKDGSWRIDLLDQAAQNESVTSLVHEYGHILAFKYGANVSSPVQEGWAGQNVLRYVLFRNHDSSANRMWDKYSGTSLVYSTIGGTSGMAYTHTESVSHGYSAPWSYADEQSPIYSPYSPECGPYVAMSGLGKFAPTFEAHHCGNIIPMVYWELAFNDIQTPYADGSLEHIIQNLPGEPHVLANKAFTFAIASVSSGASIRDFFDAVSLFYDNYSLLVSPGGGGLDDLQRVGSVLGHHCVGWGLACDDEPWKRIIPEGLALANLHRTHLTDGDNKSELFLIRDLPERVDFSAPRLGTMAKLCNMSKAITFEADLPAFSDYSFEISHAGPLTVDGEVHLTIDEGGPFKEMDGVVTKNYLYTPYLGVPIPTSNLSWDRIPGSVVLKPGRHVFKIQSKHDATDWDCVLISAISVARGCAIHACDDGACRKNGTSILDPQCYQYVDCPCQAPDTCEGGQGGGQLNKCGCTPAVTCGGACGPVYDTKCGVTLDCGVCTQPDGLGDTAPSVPQSAASHSDVAFIGARIWPRQVFGAAHWCMTGDPPAPAYCPAGNFAYPSSNVQFRIGLSTLGYPPLSPDGPTVLAIMVDVDENSTTGVSALALEGLGLPATPGVDAVVIFAYDPHGTRAIDYRGYVGVNGQLVPSVACSEWQEDYGHAWCPRVMYPVNDTCYTNSGCDADPSRCALHMRVSADRVGNALDIYLPEDYFYDIVNYWPLDVSMVDPVSFRYAVVTLAAGVVADRAPDSGWATVSSATGFSVPNASSPELCQ